MEWPTRTLEELLAAKPERRPGTSNEVLVFVNPDEGRTLAAAGAKVTSGNENLERNTQRYHINGVVYFWLAGYGYSGGSWEDEFPVSDQVDPRLRMTLEAVKAFGPLD